MNWDDFDAHFDRCTASVFRLERLQDYTAPGEAERIAAFLHGQPRPERSVRTSPWLARIAVSTAAQGKRWRRVRIVEEPLTDYTRYELASYVESQAVGEEIRIARRASAPALETLRHDFWLFDAETSGTFALLLDYADDGTWLGGELVTDPRMLARFRAERDLALTWSVALNEYLAHLPRHAV